MQGKVLDEYIEILLKKEDKTPDYYRAAAGAPMDLRVPVLPNTYDFEGVPEYTTEVPPPLQTPLSAPVADGVNMNGAEHG